MFPVPAYIPFFHSVEFYVIATVVAAAVLAVCLRPSRKGQAVLHTVAGFLCEGVPEAEPALHVECLESGNVLIRRTGLSGIYATGALSLAVNQIGFDLEIQERLPPGAGFDGLQISEAVFVLNFLGPDWYHISYTTDPSDRFAAFSLHVRPGLKTTVPLKQ